MTESMMGSTQAVQALCSPSIADGEVDGCVGGACGLVVAQAALPQHWAGARVQVDMTRDGQIYLQGEDLSSSGGFAGSRYYSNRLPLSTSHMQAKLGHKQGD